MTIKVFYKEINIELDASMREMKKDECKFKEFEEKEAGKAYIFCSRKDIKVLATIMQPAFFRVSCFQSEEDI